MSQRSSPRARAMARAMIRAINYAEQNLSDPANCWMQFQGVKMSALISTMLLKELRRGRRQLILQRFLRVFFCPEVVRVWSWQQLEKGRELLKHWQLHVPKKHRHAQARLARALDSITIAAYRAYPMHLRIAFFSQKNLRIVVSESRLSRA